MKITEDRLQADCFKWAWNTYKELRYKIFHIPNGGKRSKREGAKFKAMGVLAGVPDLQMIYNKRHYFFELKTPTEKLSPEQKALYVKWGEEGINVTIIRSLQEFQSAINSIINN